MNRTKIKELIIGLAKHDLCLVIMDATNLSENDINLETNAQPMVDGVMIYLEDSASNILFAKKIMESIYTLYDVILSSFVQRNDGRDGYDEYFFAQFTIKAKTLEGIKQTQEYKFATKGAEEIEKIQKEISDFSKMLSDKNIWMINLEPKIKMLQRKIEELQTESIEKEKIKKQLTEINEEMDNLRAEIVEKEKVVEDYMDIRKHLPKE